MAIWQYKAEKADNSEILVLIYTTISTFVHLFDGPVRSIPEFLPHHRHMSLESPGIFYFEDSAGPSELVEIFRYSTWDQQSPQLKASLSSALQHKLRQLTLISMAMGAKSISYSDASQKLEIPMAEIELFLVEALLDKAVHGRVNAATQTLHIYSCATRQCNAEQAAGAKVALKSFMDRLETVIHANMTRLKAAAPEDQLDK